MISFTGCRHMIVEETYDTPDGHNGSINDDLVELEPDVDVEETEGDATPSVPSEGTNEVATEIEDYPTGFGEFKIFDKRDVITDIIGRYVYEEDPEFFLEIFEDYVVLNDLFLERRGFTDACRAKAVEILIDVDKTRLIFYCKRTEGKCNSAASSFFSEGEGVFYFSFLHNPDDIIYFIKQ